MSEKEVYFHNYCPSCEYYETTETDLPCDECLEDGCNDDSHKPTHFKEKQ